MTLAKGHLVMGLLVAVVTAYPANAQSTLGMTAEEITKAFEKQKTRGLILVPSGGVTEGSADSAQTTQVAPAASEYQAVDREDQVFVNISFDLDSAALRADQKPKLATICQVMNSVDVRLFQIVGHTDSSGSAAYNENLSRLRAEEVKRHLVNECGIAPERLQAIGMGEEAPLNGSDPLSGENRRVEFQALG